MSLLNKDLLGPPPSLPIDPHLTMSVPEQTPKGLTWASRKEAVPAGLGSALPYSKAVV